jgi:hypothetical protein
MVPTVVDNDLGYKLLCKLVMYAQSTMHGEAPVVAGFFPHEPGLTSKPVDASQSHLTHC